MTKPLQTSRSSLAPARILAPALAALFVLATSTTDARTLASVSPAESDAAVDQFLQEHALNELLADQLRTRLASVSGEERTRVAERLGTLYLQFINASRTDDERARWEAKAQQLASMVPEARNLELRLSVARALYAPLEALAERVRLRLDAPGEREDAISRLTELARRFDTLANDLARRVNQLEGASPNPRDPDRLTKDIDAARKMRSAAMYFAGWTNVYLASLSSSRDAASKALVQLGWNTGADGRPAALQFLESDFLKFDHVARAVVGIALAESATGDHEDAARWLDRLDSTTSVPDAVKRTLLRRRIEVLAAAGRWKDLEGLLSPASATGPALDAVSARTLAVLALESSRANDADVLERLASLGLRELVGQHQLGQVVDLVRLHGGAMLGDRGFVPALVRAIELDESALAAHLKTGATADVPATDDSIRLAFERAADAYDASLRERDAPASGGVWARTLEKAGQARLHARQFALASERLLRAARVLTDAGDRVSAEAATWAALLAIDAGSRAKLPDGSALPDAADLAKRFQEQSVLFIRTFPASPRAAKLLVRRGDSSGVSDDEAVRILLGVPRDDESYVAARRQAARLLYRLMRAAPADQRASVVASFAPVAEEVLSADRRESLAQTSPEASRAAGERVLITARQLLEALLSVDPPDVTRAQAAMGLISAVAAHAGLDTREIEPELLYRRVQIALARGQSAEAESLVQQLARAVERKPGDAAPSAPARFATAAERLLFTHAARAWQSSSDDPSAKPRLALARRVVERAGPVLSQLGPLSAERVREPTTLGVLGVAAAAAFDLWSAERDAADRDAALRFDAEIRKAFPDNPDSLRRTAQLAEAAKDTRTALDAWRRLSSGLAPGSPEWFQTRFAYLRLLAESDPQGARAALDQHAALYPSFGPEPWGTRLRDLQQMLGGPLPKGKRP